ncbi:MAG: RnfABCDGE type electron transport complex subunit D, partial [Oscillospiraceae bacterium]|nr:RnfABCDGE type electron transport complex subunit D [Oscillospiraceae bacterium]
MNPRLNLSAGPHVRDRWSTAFIMRMVLLALMPATVVGIITFGLHALWVVLSSVVTAVLTELVFDKLTGRPDSWKDGSAAVTGLLLALTLSAQTPLYVPILGSIFAILVVKCAFGGLGKNFINPALTARCFLLISFSGVMTAYGMDGVSSATPCVELAAGHTVNISSMFLGSANGVIGGSIAALLLGGLALWVFDIIHGQICFSVLGAFTLCMALFGGQGFDPGFLAAHLCGGGVVLGAFFMATDYVTSPMSRLGQTVYGVLIGVLGALFRIKGQSPDSFSYSIIVANLFVPLIDT